MKNLVTILYLCLVQFAVYAQFQEVEKSPEYSDLGVVPIQGYLQDSLSFNTYDSSLNRFFYHYPFLSSPQVVVSHYGGAIYPTFFNINSGSYSSGINSWNAYSMAENGDNTYSAIQPFTTVTYHNGPQEEQGIGFNHTQNINSNLNVGFFYDNFVGQSYYINSQSRTTRFRTYGGYRSKDGRHQVAGDYSIYVLEKGENGGLIDTLNVNILDSISNKAAIPAYLEEASHFNKYNIARLYHRTLLGSKDTNGVISLKAPILFSQFTYLKHRSLYSDPSPDSSYYTKYDLLAPNAIHDSLAYQRFSGRIGLRQNLGRLTFAAAALFNQEHYDEGLFQENNFESGLTGSIQWQNAKGWLFRDTLAFILNGRNAGGGYHMFTAQIPISNKYLFKAQLNNVRVKPGYVYQAFDVDSVLTWDNDVQLSLQQTVSGVIQRRGNATYQLGVHYSIVDQYPFFDSKGVADQSAATLQVLQANLRALLHAGDLFLDLQFNYQVTNNQEVLRLPTWWAFASLYTEKPVFKNAITTRIGVDFHYNELYEAPGFNPLTRSFYNQQGVSLGRYPWVDAYLMVQIRRAKIYAKLTNVLQGLVEENYSYIPNYPMEPRSFRIAFRWDFWN